MALLPKKTYSRRNNECSLICEKEKENIDPFDELLSSPLKHEVQFQPLSYWNKRVKNFKSKKKSEKMKYELYESSDSDELNSPCQRKRKHNSKNSVSKARTLKKKIIQEQYKSANCKLHIKRDDFSTANSQVKRVKPNKSLLLNENNNLVSSKFLSEMKDCFSNSTLIYNDNVEETLLSSSYNSCDNLEFFTNRSKQDCINNSNENFCRLLEPFKSNKSIIKGSKEFYSNTSTSYSNFKMHENVSSTIEQSNSFGEVIYKDIANGTLTFNDRIEETPRSFYKDHDSHKFISVKRHFNYPNFLTTFYENYNQSLKPAKCKKTDRSLNQSWNELENSFSSYHLKVKPCDSSYTQTESIGSTNDETYINNEEDLMNSSLGFDESTVKSFCNVDHSIPKNERLKVMSVSECYDESTLSDCFDFECLSNTKIEDLIQDLLELQNISFTVDGVEEDSSSTTDETLYEFKKKDSGINISPKPKEDDPLIIGSDTKREINHFSSPSSGVSLLTTGISNLSISNVTDHELTEVDKLRVSQDTKNFKGKNNDSFLIDLRNVTTKRRGRLKDAYENNVSCAIDRRSNIAKTSNKKRSMSEPKFEQTFELSRTTNRMAMDCDKSIFLANPLFESTRVVDMGFMNGKISQKQINLSANIMEETSSNHKFSLKPGKKWLRSVSVLKQLQNRSLIEERFESTKITGKKFENFIHEILEMQNDQSVLFLSSTDFNDKNKTFTDSGVKNSFSTHLSGYKTLLQDKRIQKNELKVNQCLIPNDSVFSKNASQKVVEKSLFNHTVKIIDSKEGPSYFRSALGLAVDRSSILDDSIKNNCSAISARDFILMQCGQDDVLSFEEYFNERTLKNCKKIGEGVYGEVFLSCDSVIKIIPIEGLEKVNGEPQKTFEEIISEVVIASKLSDLRKGERFRTDGFSELKRCWCVKGKYPKYLLKLWNEYDQLGSGSENDSPVMFKDDQLYLILELANGGKDLESFIFSSSVQSLSIFIQAAFSLAAAEKAYEFEHRDLHWGNVLISETQKKFMSIVLDNVEYKIPTKGVQVCIIDFTLSRINHEDCCIFNDLSVDPTLFASEGDYQFEIYRMMLIEVKNDWSLFRPKTNLFWLHYMLDKMIKMVHYKNRKAKIHLKHLKNLKTLESVILEFQDSINFVLSKSLTNTVHKL